MLYINIHTHNPSYDSNILEIQSLFHTQASLSEKFPNHLFSIGIHPWHTKDIVPEKEINNLETLVSSKNIAAIGECGIDKLKGAGLNEQIKIFKAQALIAEKVKKPVIIHCVKAYKEIISIHKEMKPSIPWIIHNFNKNEQLADQMIRSGFILSFGNSLIQKLQLSKLFTSLPNNFIFLETDEEPGNKLRLLYEFATKNKNVSLEQFTQIVNRNFEKIFKIKADDWIK